MIRFASLNRTYLASQRGESPGRLHSLDPVRTAILRNVTRFVSRQANALRKLRDDAATQGVHFVYDSSVTPGIRALGRKLFETRVLPSLGVPEPFSPGKLLLLENLQMAAISTSQRWFSIPKTLPHVLWERDAKTGEIFLFFLDELLAANLTLNPSDRYTFVRLTRDGDFEVDLNEEDTESIPDVVRSSVSIREKGVPVRLQYRGSFSESMLDEIRRVLKLSPNQVFRYRKTLCLHGMYSTVSQMSKELPSREGLLYPKLRPQVPLPFFNPKQLFDRLREQDILLHHPYDSFDAFVTWIQTACEDPSVISIEQTVYRMDSLSPIIDALKAAASSKKIRVVIEARARFDELNNLRLADDLRRAGVEVHFGYGKLKVHAKITLVTRKEGDTQRLYTHLSTGNYNATTARQYTDLAVLTANPEIGNDARIFFDAIYRGQVPTTFKVLAAAPSRLHKILLQHIEAETKAALEGRPARIVAKVNALVDGRIVDSLYRASSAGVKIDLIVRGACSLVPRIKGLSESIRVISVVDRFLEHSRIYYFQSSDTMYISSADWMPRNFFSRLEIAFPVLDPRLRRFIKEVILSTYLSDNVKAWELSSSRTWRRRRPGPDGKALRSQFQLEKLAQEGYRGTPLE